MKSPFTAKPDAHRDTFLSILVLNTHSPLLSYSTIMHEILLVAYVFRSTMVQFHILTTDFIHLFLYPLRFSQYVFNIQFHSLLSFLTFQPNNEYYMSFPCRPRSSLQPYRHQYCQAGFSPSSLRPLPCLPCISDSLVYLNTLPLFKSDQNDSRNTSLAFIVLLPKRKAVAATAPSRFYRHWIWKISITFGSRS